MSSFYILYIILYHDQILYPKLCRVGSVPSWTVPSWTVPTGNCADLTRHQLYVHHKDVNLFFLSRIKDTCVHNC